MDGQYGYDLEILKTQKQVFLKIFTLDKNIYQ